jgi:hypothetical protein
MENFESVYVLTNKEMPGICKIGYTSKNDINERTKQLYTTGVPHPFDVYCILKVKDGRRYENTIHEIFSENRVRPDREFFRIHPEQVKNKLLSLQSEELIYISKENILYKPKRKRMPNFTFSELNIPIGAILYFSRNNTITCIVHSDNSVIYNGKIMTLTEAARFTGMIPFKEIQGPKFWMYENELLTIRRKFIQVR